MNRLITAEQLANDAFAIMEQNDIPRLFAEAPPEEQREMLRALSNMFGGGFPA